jgi:hypothetical protein
MYNLRLIPDIRSRQSLVQVFFAFEQELIPLVKSQPRIGRLLSGYALKRETSTAQPRLKRIESPSFSIYKNRSADYQQVNKKTIFYKKYVSEPVLIYSSCV